MMARELTVACVLRRGGDYTSEHVARLWRSVEQWWAPVTPLRFVVLTDAKLGPMRQSIEVRRLQYNWPKWWAKMELFTAAQDDLGDILYFDLDTMIVSYLHEVLRAPRGITMLRDFYHEERVQSGMMYLPKEDRPEVCAAWLSSPRAIMTQYRGDGEFLDSLWRAKAERWQDIAPEAVVSYKVHVHRTKDQRPPREARVVCFHGKPRPWETPLW